jgi:hypothetical protein
MTGVSLVRFVTDLGMPVGIVLNELMRGKLVGLVDGEIDRLSCNYGPLVFYLYGEFLLGELLY